MIMVYTTCSDREEARKIAKHLIAKNLISDANLFPCESIYKNGPDLDTQEYVLLAKAEEEYFYDVKEQIKEVHSYEMPVIAKIPVTFNSEYVSWMERELR